MKASEIKQLKIIIAFVGCGFLFLSLVFFLNGKKYFNKFKTVEFSGTVEFVDRGMNSGAVIIKGVKYSLRPEYPSRMLEFIDVGDSLVKQKNDYTIALLRKKENYAFKRYWEPEGTWLTRLY